ncbi:MAG: SMP-30/gluconolactonase/LRE family protein [Ardenticatenaceae bacterium]|nr:SMP-30/gluconolactonase/LRE family protein [Ardenticatenaceae bacterium]
MKDVVCVWQTNAKLGEGPLWVAAENSIYWLDILNKHVHRLDLGSGERHTWAFPVAITSLAIRQSGGFVGTTVDGFAVIDFDSQTAAPIVLPEENLSGNRFNDGKVDGNGRFWAGSMDNNGKKPTGTLYRLDPNLTLHTIDDGYIITNGPAFSTDGKTMYHTDSVRGIVYAFDLHNDGAVGGKRPFIHLTFAKEGAPDGMTVDSENCLWLAHYGGARLTRYSPAGEILQVVPLPVPNVTSCTFGGPNLDTLYITTASQQMSAAELEKYPLAGSLFAYQPGVTGLPTPKFIG